MRRRAATMRNGFRISGTAAYSNEYEMDYPDFRTLSFGKLRKTAGNLIKRFSDGETAGVFLCHGTPVKTDALSDVYTNRDFAKVFAAIKKGRAIPATDVRCRTQRPLQATAQPTDGTAHRQSRCEELWRQGSSIKEIAEKLDVAVSTVSGHLRGVGKTIKPVSLDGPRGSAWRASISRRS